MSDPDLPMLLPPAMEPSDPIHVSTFAKPEYADLTFTYGKVKSGGNWPVHCKEFKVHIPTGRQASALTSEPGLIHYKLTVPDGKRQWIVERDTGNPNETVFTCSPPPGEPAAFDGTWSVELKLWGIEVNGGVGPVDIVWKESTSTTGADGLYQERKGRGEVKKLDDSFYLHSFRPDPMVISRGSKATLKWEGTPHAEYTMYYRKPDGTQGSSTAEDGIWTSPVDLVDDTSFTLEAKMGEDEIRYLTTYIEVNNPDIAVNNVTANGNLTAVAADSLVRIRSLGGPYGEPLGLTSPTNTAALTVGGTLTANGDVDAVGTEKKVRIANLYGPYGVPLKIHSLLNVTGTLTADGAIQANGDVTIAAAKTLTVNKIKASSDGQLTIENNPTGTPAEINAARMRLVFATGKVGGADRLGYLDVTGIIQASKIKGVGTYNELILNGITRIDGSLRGPGSASTEPVVIPGPLRVGGTLEGQWIKPALGITVPDGQGIYVNGGKRVIANGDKISLRNERKVNNKDSRLLADNKHNPPGSPGYLNVFSYEGYQGSNGNHWFIEDRTSRSSVADVEGREPEHDRHLAEADTDEPSATTGPSDEAGEPDTTDTGRA
ncbi:hypothetical protein [Streptomyces lydicus]|uniref:hypothetical protein n=1 Tax=Streptomyces lydicus TaxID=47763 RepID=UPI0010136E8F|nr:hypothetical protein [Streptomyces lydicus]MCZ1006769.1 hypothetical protein [Streptomyces lydicus]